MFENELFERFSRIHPVTPFVVWVPAVLVLLARSASRHDLGVAAGGGLFVAGAFAWTFAEYVLHRWVFHWQHDSPWGRRVHFLLHGVHHGYPNDKDRLVMPLPASIPLSVIFYTLWTSLFQVRFGEPFFAGFIAGYLVYDGTHYAVHHFRQHTAVGRLIKRHHMLHHHADHDGGFGVSSPLWDLVFGTMPQVRKLKPQRPETSSAV